MHGQINNEVEQTKYDKNKQNNFTIIHFMVYNLQAALIKANFSKVYSEFIFKSLMLCFFLHSASSQVIFLIGQL